MMAGEPDPSTANAAHRNTRMPPLSCPRCDSSNTKFCYYNNYSLSQPRHFCKSCKRYWTRGGTLRNVPVGGGCRKNKRGKKKPYRSGAAAVVAPSLQPPSALHDSGTNLSPLPYGFPQINPDLNFFPKFELDAPLPVYEENIRSAVPSAFLGDYTALNSQAPSSPPPSESYHYPFPTYNDLPMGTENSNLDASMSQWQVPTENSDSGGAVRDPFFLPWNQAVFGGSWPDSSSSSIAPLT